MSSYKINGGDKVFGSIKISGAKNFVTKAMVAGMLGDSPSTITNVSFIGDVDLTAKMIRSTGGSVEFDDQLGSITIDPSTITTHKVTLPDEGSNRIPILMVASLIKKFSQAEIPYPGGCAIGERKVDFHISAMEQFGLRVEYSDTGLIAYIGEGNELKGCEITLPFSSVGATESVLFFGAIAKGTTILKNAAIEPEIVELITMLQTMGVKIFWKGDRILHIEGSDEIRGTSAYALGDRIEAVSWASLACGTDGRILVRGVDVSLLSGFIPYFIAIGGGMRVVSKNEIEFFRQRQLTPVALTTGVYPSFSTDWQQPFAVMMSQALGESSIHETIYENRLGYLLSLRELGFDVELSTECLDGEKCWFDSKGYFHTAKIRGITPLISNNCVLDAPDLRAGMSFVIAGAVAKGLTTITNIQRIERGYGDLIERCKDLTLAITKS